MATSPRTISQRIALEGAEELQRQLERIGQTGEDAFKKNADAIALAARRLESFVGLVQRVETAMASVANAGRAFGANLAGAGQALVAFEASASRLVRNLVLLAGGGGLIGAAAVGLARFATASARAADELAENAAAAGLSVEAYQRLQFAAQTAGVKQSQFGTIMGRLSDQFVDARKAQIAFAQAASRENNIEFTDQEVMKLIKSVAQAGVAFDKFGNDIGNTKNAFLRFGIDIRKLSLEDAMLKVGDALRKLPDDTARAAAGFEIFGARTGPKFAQFLASAREALKGFEEEFRKIGITEKEAKIGGETSDRLDLMSVVADKAKKKLGAVFDPLVREGADAITQAILRNFGTMERFAQSIKQRIEPAVRDFIRILNGETEQIETKWILDARDNIVAFGQSVERVVKGVVLPAFQLLVRGLELLSESINKVFGTSLTATDVAIIAVIGRITGAFALLTAGVRLAFAAVRTFFGAFRVVAAILGGFALIAGGPATIAAAFATAAVAIVLSWDKIRKAAFDAWEAIRQKWSKQPTDAERLPDGQSGLDLLLTRLQKTALDVWEAIRQKWSTSPVPALQGDRLPIQLIFERLGQKALEVWNSIRQQWSVSPIPALPGDKLPIELIFERLVERAQSAWNRIREIWSTNPADTRTALPEGQSALSALLAGRSDDNAAREAVDATRELAAQRARLGQVTGEAAQSEQELTQAVEQGTQAASDVAATHRAAAQAIANARQQQQNLARAARDSNPIFVQAGNELRELGVEGAQAAVKARQEQQNLTRAVQGSSATLARDLATPFKTAQVEVEKLRTGIQSLGQTAAPAAAAGTAASAAAGSGPFTGLVTQAQAARTQILAIFQGLNALIAQAISGGGAVAGGPGVGPTEGALAAGAAVTGGVGPFSSLLTQAQAAVQQIVQLFGGLGQQLTEAITTGLQGLGPAIQVAIQQIPLAFQSMVGLIEQAVAQMLQSVTQASRQAIQALEEVVRAAREAAGAVERVGRGQGFASGGYTGGGGTRRVAGVVHGGEYVQPARVVRQPGVMAFMETLRRTGDLNATMRRFVSGFDLGGLVPSVPAPRFAYAGGGAVQRSGTPINLFLPGGQKVELRGGADAVRVLTTEAVRGSYLSLGRKPSRYT